MDSGDSTGEASGDEAEDEAEDEAGDEAEDEDDESTRILKHGPFSIVYKRDLSLSSFSNFSNLLNGKIHPFPRERFELN